MPKTFLIIDAGGLSVDVARKLGQEGHKVLYWTPWHSAYSKFEDYAVGVGFPEIERVDNYAGYLDESDCIIYPDVGMGEQAHFFREKGYVVFGAGLGEVLEQDRGESCRIMDRVGIKHPETQVFLGVDKALEFFKQIFSQKHETNQNATGKYFVKFNKFRGTIDSFPVSSIEEAEFMFNDVRSGFGPYSSQIPVIVQKTVEGIECGADLFFNGDKFLLPGMIGFESSGNYIGQIVSDLGIYKNDLDRIAKYLRSVNYRGAFSFECIYDGKNLYWFDITCRFPMPLGLMYANSIKNYGDFLMQVATGEATRFPVEEGQFLGCMEVQSEEALSRYIPLKGGSNTRFMHYMMNNGKSYSVPGVSLVGVVCSQGDSMEDVESKIEKESKELSVFFGNFKTRFLDDIKEKYIQPMSDMGISFGDAVANPVQVQPKKKIESISDTDVWGIPLH